MGVILIVLQISHGEHFLKEIMFGVQHFVMYASIKSFSFLCWTLRTHCETESEHQV